MNARNWQQRRSDRRARTATGPTSIRVTKATRDLLAELESLVQPFEAKGLDELIYRLAQDELARRRQPTP